MSKLNKIVTNYPVTLTPEEVANLSETLSGVRTAGGGGTGGKTYIAGDSYINVDNTHDQIKLTEKATGLLERDIPSAVSQLSDSASYAKVEALSNYQPVGDYLSANALDNLSGTWETVTDKLDKTEFAEVSGDFLIEASLNGYATEQYVQAASAEVTGWVNTQNYLKTVPDTYYLKTETSGKDEISAAFNEVMKYNVTAAAGAGVHITTATDNHVTTYGLSFTAQPVVTDTTLSGYSGIAANQDATVTGQWNIGLTQDMLNTINGKLDSTDFTTYTGTTAPNTYLTKTSADTLYQPTGDYVTTADVLTGTSNTLTGIKIGSTDYTIPTTDLSDYYTKTQVDSTFASASQLNSYLTTAQYETDSATYVTSGSEISAADEQYALTTTGWAKVDAGTSFTGVTTTGSVSGGGSNNDKIGLLTSAENALTAVANKVDKPDTTQTDLNNKYLVYSTLSAEGAVTGWTDFNANVYSKSESDGRYQKKTDMSSYLTTAQYETDSATFVTSSSQVITGDAQYVLTSGGWEELEGGISTAETNNYVSGDGTVQYPIGLSAEAASAIEAMTDQYQIDGSQYVTVVPNTATKKVVIGLDNQVSNAVNTVAANANIWNNASAVSAKSHTTIDNTTNVITTENQGTSANLSAVEYKDNVNVAGMNVQQIYAVRNDGDIYACLSTTANKGTLFFVCSGV